MENEQVINTLKGISSILVVMSETRGEIIWNGWGMQLLNTELLKCIEILEKNMN